MTEPAFPAAVEKALDSYVVPPLPPGFTDRLIARLGPAPTEPLPVPRRRSTSPWRRGGRIFGSLAILSVATATAAAAGVFGDPVYVPVVSEALVEAKIVAAPPKAEPKVRIIAAPKAEPAALPAAEAPKTGSAAIVERVASLRKDPEFAKLPPRQKLQATRREVRQMLRSGEATPADVRVAVREIVQNADPATKEAWRKAAEQRRAERSERRTRWQTASPEERAAMLREVRERREALASQQGGDGTDATLPSEPGNEPNTNTVRPE
jgi:hypothetical protein